VRGALLATALLSLAGQSEPRFALRAGCVLPYAAYAPARDAMHFCDNAGRRAGMAPPPLADRLRLDAQNNLCAATSAPVPMALKEFALLPSPPSSQLATSRKSLARVVVLPGRADVGEGTVVRTVGLISKAHIVGCQDPAPGDPAGSAVTCHFMGGPKISEIQLNLSPITSPSDTPDCQAVVAKLITHYRPIWWDDIDIKTPEAPVRITGQLFYDNQAEACGGRAPSSRAVGARPARLTRWEVHPVYGIDVCIAPEAGCDPMNGARWVPYHQWLDRPEARVRASGISERVACREASLKWLTSQGREDHP
jgi:hypothetical protein